MSLTEFICSLVYFNIKMLLNSRNHYELCVTQCVTTSPGLPYMSIKTLHPFLPEKSKLLNVIIVCYKLSSTPLPLQVHSGISSTIEPV